MLPPFNEKMESIHSMDATNRVENDENDPIAAYWIVEVLETLDDTDPPTFLHSTTHFQPAPTSMVIKIEDVTRHSGTLPHSRKKGQGYSN
jgi:hypothetical protein